MANPRVEEAKRMTREHVRKYAKRGDTFYQRLIRNPTALANYLRAVSGFFTSRPLSPRELMQAATIVRESVKESGGQVPSDYRALDYEEQELGQRANLARRMQLGGAPGGEIRDTEQEQFATSSSNVYSFSYTPESRTRGILYVTFRHGKPTHYVSQVNKTTGKKYRMGVKPFVRGPMYAYFDVPQAVYTRLKSASSVGETIWDDLRIRGSVYGHQYRYTLVAGAKTGPAFDDVYVPRKATQRGFAKRSVRLTGRRQFVASNLAPERREFRGTSRDVYEQSIRRFRGN